MHPFIAFLRGINVGGHKLVPMVELRSLFLELGFSDARTVLQSGNVVFMTPSADTKKSLETKLERAFTERFGFSSDFVVRSGSELSKAISANPFPAEAKKDPSHLLVMFLREPVSTSAFNGFQKTHTGPELVASSGRDFYIYYPAGIARSKLKIPFSGTARNWNTVLKLREML